MSANGIAHLPTKQERQLAKLDIAEARRQGYSDVVPTGSQRVNSSLYPDPVYPFGSLKVVSDGAGNTYLVFESGFLETAITSYLYDGAPLHNLRFAGADHFDAVSIVGGLVDCSTLAGASQVGAVGYLLSASLGVTANNNVGYVEIPNGRFQGSGTLDTSAPFYRDRNVYDITLLPDTYNGNVPGADDNPNVGGLVEGRPWIVPRGSLAFAGTGQYLTGTGNSGLTLDGDFTIEMWIDGGAQSNSFPTLIAQTGPYSGNATQLYICVSHSVAANVITLHNGPAGGDILTGSIVVTDNVWHHIAVTRLNGVVRLYVDGVADGNYSGNFTVDYSNFSIGSNPSDGGATTTQLSYAGAISNLRIVKGTAVYTAPFTSPTAPLTAIAGTQLLLNTTYNANFLVDSSTNNFTVTNNGSVTSSALTPF